MKTLREFVELISEAQPQYKVGDEVKINNPNSRNHGQTGTVTSIASDKKTHRVKFPRDGADTATWEHHVSELSHARIT